MNLIEVAVSYPAQWWLAEREDLPWLEDPDLQDGHQRHADRDDLDWYAIGAAVESVGRRMMTAPIVVDEDQVPYVVGQVNVEGFADEEVNIVQRWFWADSGPCADPWRDQLFNGRHRLFNVWRASASFMLPVRSELLAYPATDTSLGESYGRQHALFAAESYAAVPPAVAARSPRFLAELHHRAIAGGIDVDPRPSHDTLTAIPMRADLPRPSEAAAWVAKELAEARANDDLVTVLELEHLERRIAAMEGRKPPVHDRPSGAPGPVPTRRSWLPWRRGG